MNSIIVNLDDATDVNTVYNQIRRLYPAAKSIKVVRNDNEFQNLLFASESSLGFWDNDVDDKVWNDA